MEVDFREVGTTTEMHVILETVMKESLNLQN